MSTSRVGVRGGGCSGFQYALAFVQRDDDEIFEDHGLRRWSTAQACRRCPRGAILDYVESLQGAGSSRSRTRTRPPPAGCGSSFPRLAEEEEVSSAV